GEGGGAGGGGGGGGADAVARQHDAARLLLVDPALGVVVDDAVRSPVGPKCDLAHASARDEPCAAGQGLGPVRDVGAGLGTDRATPVARSTVVARAPAVVGTRDDRAVRRPPVPAEPIEPAGHGLAQLADR